MRLSLVVFALIINALIAKAQGGDAGRWPLNGDGWEPMRGGYTYEINVQRTHIESQMGNRIASAQLPFPPFQTISYFVDINEDHPFIIQGEITRNDVIVYSRDKESQTSNLTACDPLNVNSWDYFMIEVFNKGFTKNDGCFIKKGEYTMNAELDPIHVAFDSMISCGDYDVAVELYISSSWVLAGHFWFNIPNDGNCTP